MITVFPPLMFAGALAVVSIALVLAAWSDVRSFTIPNRLCAAIAAAYPMALLILPAQSWFLGLATGTIILLIGAVLFAQRWVGGGDVKLASAIALWAGPAFLADFIWVTSLAGVALAVSILLTPLPRLLARGRMVETGFHQPMPFGVALAAGGLWVVIQQSALI